MVDGTFYVVGIHNLGDQIVLPNVVSVLDAGVVCAIDNDG